MCVKLHFEENFVEGICLDPTTITDEIVVATDRNVIHARSFSAARRSRSVVVPSDAAADEFHVTLCANFTLVVGARELLAALQSISPGWFDATILFAVGVAGHSRSMIAQTSARFAWQHCLH